MSKNTHEDLDINGKGLSIAIICARYNKEYVQKLAGVVSDTLKEKGVENIAYFSVPGSAELPFAASRACKTKKFDAVIVLGLVIQGDTIHDKVIANSTAFALQNVAIKRDIPIINGIITVANEEQAKERIFGKTNRGAEFARATIEMALLGL